MANAISQPGQGSSSDGWTDLPSVPTSSPSVSPVSNQPPSSSEGGWNDVYPTSSTKGAVPITEGQDQFAKDKKIVADAAGIVPDQIKAVTYSGLNTFMLNSLSPVIAGVNSIVQNRPYSEVFKEQKDYEDALSRQYPVSSAVGTAAGIGASLFVPIGAAGLAAEGAGLGARMLMSGAVGAGMGGVSGYLNRFDIGEAAKGAALGAGLGAAGEGIASGLSKYLAKAPDVFDAAGNPTQHTLDTVKSAFGGNLSPDDAKAFLGKYQELLPKAVSPEAAMRDALLQERGVTTPTRSMTTGEKAAPQAADIREASQDQATQAIGTRVLQLKGDVPAAPNELAERFHAAGLTSQDTGAANYAGLRGIRGVFDDSIVQNVMPYVQDSLKENGFGSHFSNTPAFPQSNEALKFLNTTIAAKEYPINTDPLTLNNMEMVRQGLNTFWAKASDQDRIGINAIKDGFDNFVTDSLKGGAFSGDAQKAQQALNASRSSWAEFKSSFYPSTKAGIGGSDINKITQSLADKASGRFQSNPSQGGLEDAQKILDSSMINPKIASGFYDRLNGIFGSNSYEMNLVGQHIRDAVLNTNGDISKLPASIDKFLDNNGSLASKVFQPDEIQEMRKISEATKIINQKPIPPLQKESLFSAVASSLRSGIGPAVIGHVFGNPFIGGAIYFSTATASAGKKIAKAVVPSMAEKSGSQALLAAPEWAGSLAGSFPASTATGVQTLSRLPQAASSNKKKQGYQEPSWTPPPLTISPNRSGFRSGGSVSIADQLVSDVDRAKKEIDGKTKTFLGVHDNHVAHALEIANKNLEG